MEGSHVEAYEMVRMYGNEILQSNPGSLVAIETDSPDSDGRRPFKRIFIVFHALTIGFIQGCRPFIGLDGCHLKGSYGGCSIGCCCNGW